MLRILPALMILLAGCTNPLAADDSSTDLDQGTVPIAALISEYAGSVTIVVEVLQQDDSTPPRQVYQFIEYNDPVTPDASQDPECGTPTELEVAIVDALSGEQLRKRSVPYSCDGQELLLFIDQGGDFAVAPLDHFAEMPRSWQRGDPWPWADADDDTPTEDDAEDGDSNVASFPNVSVKESATAGVIEMEHLGGDCIWIPDEYEFRVNDGAVTPRTSAQGGSIAQNFCVGDNVYFNGEDGSVNEIVVTDLEAQSQVYKKKIQL